MGQTTEIAWCDATFNAWIGCTKLTRACDFCYAETLAKRYGWAEWGVGKPRHRTSTEYWKQPLRWHRTATEKGVRLKVFANSLSDVFDTEVRPEWRSDLFELIEATPALDWLILTKRTKVMRDFFRARDEMPANVWAGTTAEDQPQWDSRVAYLRQVPARVIFVSIEPMLGPIDIAPMPGVDWIICGGESGQHARPLNLDWARSLRDQCAAVADLPFFFKQVGGLTPTSGGHLLDGREHKEFPT